MKTPYIETACTVEFQGRKFASGGAVVADDYVIAYVGKKENGAPRALTDWHGNRLGICYLTSNWPIRNGWVASRMYQIEAYINGVRYTGRGCGEGMVCRLRRAKGKA